MNLSRALARLGRRVVLIDGGDHGGLARLFRVDPVPGLRDVLNREAQPRTALRMVSERLALLPSGASAGDVVDPDRAKAVIHELLAYADVVVVAATPVQSGPGALAWARAVEGTVLIARRDHAKREDVAAAAETLLHVGGNLVGAILAERAAPLAGLFGRGRSGSSRTVSAAPPRSPMAAPGPSISAPPPVEPPYASTSYRPSAPPPGAVSSTPPASGPPPASTLRPSIIRASGSGPAPEPTIIPSPVSAPTAAADASAAGTPVAAEPSPSPKRSTTTRSTTSRSRSTSRSSTSRSDPNSAP